MADSGVWVRSGLSAYPGLQLTRTHAVTAVRAFLRAFLALCSELF